MILWMQYIFFLRMFVDRLSVYMAYILMLIGLSKGLDYPF